MTERVFRSLFALTDVTRSPEEFRESLAHLPPEDRSAFFSMARAHGVAPLLLYQYRCAGVPSPDPDWKSKAILDVHRRREQLRFLGEFLGRAREAGLEVLILKGLAVERLLYPEPGLRVGVDVDLLLRPGMEKRMAGVMNRLGGARGERNRFWNSETWVTSNRMTLDVHYGTPWGRRFSHLWRESQELTVDELSVHTLGPEDLFLYLSCHVGVHHRYAPKLIWILDLKLLLERVPLRWDLLLRRARSLGCRDLVHRAVRIVRSVYGLRTSVPESMGGTEDVFPLFLEPRSWENRLWNEATYLRAFDHFLWPLRFYGRRLWIGVTGGR